MSTPTESAAATADRKAGIETRWVELVVALLVVVAGLVVIQDSLRVGIGWEAEGPRAGYFPFYIGCVLAITGGYLAVRIVLAWRAMAGKIFVRPDELAPVLKMLFPSIFYVVLIGFIGIYVASFLFIAAFMVWQGKYRWWVAALIAAAICTGLFFMFEVWFLVPLPKGPLESWLGY